MQPFSESPAKNSTMSWRAGETVSLAFWKELNESIAHHAWRPMLCVNWDKGCQGSWSSNIPAHSRWFYRELECALTGWVKPTFITSVGRASSNLLKTEQISKVALSTSFPALGTCLCAHILSLDGRRGWQGFSILLRGAAEETEA